MAVVEGEHPSLDVAVPAVASGTATAAAPGASGTATAAAPGASGTATAPAAVLAPSRPATRRTPIFLELGVIAFLAWIYDWLEDMAPLRKSLALSNGAAIFSFEQRLGLAPERALDHWLFHHHWLAFISSDFYDNAIFGVTLAIAAIIWWSRPDLYRRLRNDLVLANLMGFAVFWLFPVAPPRMLPGFIDIVENVGGLGSWHNLLISHADQMAAMPSMHLAWAAWCSLALWRLAKPGRQKLVALCAGIAYPLSTAWVVMATANHYLADVVAGTACLGLAVVVVELGLPAAGTALRKATAAVRKRPSEAI